MYKTTILPVFYGRETWPSSSGEDKEDKVFENRMFRKWRGPKGGDVDGSRKLHNEKLHVLY
jgi:hypothetical protein